MMGQVLITRPQDDAAEIAEIIHQLGFVPVFSPMLQIVDIAAALPVIDRYQGLIFSSANGVRALMRQNPPLDWLDCRVFAVGPGTESAARGAGFTSVQRMAGTMQGLVNFVRGAFPAPVSLLHVRGHDLRDDPALLLPDWPIDGITVYCAQSIQTMDTLVMDALSKGGGGDIRAVLFYSARSGEAFVSAIKNAGCAVDLRRTRALCLSDSVLDSIHHLNWAECHVAISPDQTGMIRLLEDLKRHDQPATAQ